jgi:hypothetical protein
MPYLSDARAKILQSIQDDFSSLICDRCLPNIYIYSGLEHAMPLASDGLEFADNGIGPSLSVGT